MTVTLETATPAAAARQLGLPEHLIDAAFGLVAIDPDRNLYAVRIPQTAVPVARPGEPFRGPFADPAIARIPASKKTDGD
jgi:hypothetical protein